MRETNLNLCAGQSGKITFTELTGYTQEPTFRGGVKVNGSCVDMQLQPDGRTLLIPPLPEGVWIYEVRADGATALWGRMRVMESPLASTSGCVCWQGTLDKDSQEVLYATLTISSGQQGEPGIQGPKGDKGDKGDPGITTEEKTYLSQLAANTTPPSSTGALVTDDDLAEHAANASHLSGADSVMLKQCSTLFDDEERSTPQGTANAWANYIELDAQHVPPGKLTSISLRGRASGNDGGSVYLGVFEQSASSTSTWVYLGTSSNSVVQTNALGVFDYSDALIVLSGRKIRLLAQEEPSEEFVTSTAKLGLRTTTAPSGDSTRAVYNGSGHAFLPELIIRTTLAQPKFVSKQDFETHTTNKIVHITREERIKWNNAVAASNGVTDAEKAYLETLVNNTAPPSHTGTLLTDDDLYAHANDATHLKEEGKVLQLKGTNGGTMLVMRGNITNVSATAGVMSWNVPDWSHKATCYCVYSLSDSGSYVPWFAAKTSEAGLSVFGITEPGAYVGNTQYPLNLRGSTLTINGTTIDTAALTALLAHKDELLALLDAGQEADGGEPETEAQTDDEATPN